MECKSKILALDLSLRSTGMVVLSNELTILKSSVIKPPIRLRHAPRLEYIISQIKSYYHQYLPELVVIEDYAFAARGMVYSIGELAGCIKLWFYQNNVPFLLINPSHLKKFVSGKGNCHKERILLAAYKKWKIDAPTDTVEAYCLARIGIEVINLLSETKTQHTAYEEDVLQKIYDTNNPGGTYDVQKGILKERK